MYDFERNSLYDESIVKLEQTVQLQSSHITTYFQERIFDVTITSDLPIVRENFEIMTTFDSNSDEYVTARDILTHNLLRIQSEYGYSEIFLIDVDHNVLLEIGIDSGDQDEVTDSFLISTMGEFDHSELFISPIFVDNMGNLEIIFGKPIISFDGKFLGHLLFEMHMNNFYSLSNFNFEFEETGETLLGSENSDGTINFISPLRFDSDGRTVHSTDGIPITLALNGDFGSGHSIDYAGNEIIAAWGPIPILDIGIVSKQNLSELYFPLNHFVAMIIFVTGLLVILIIPLSLYFTSKIIAPIKKLKKMADDVSVDNFDVYISPSGPSEIQSISKSFNHMISTLKKDRETIDFQIHELEKIDVQKAEFAAMTSHELKTPLVPIQGYCEMLLESGLIGDLNEEQKEFVTKIQSNSSHLRELIERILLVQKLDLGKVNYSCNPVNIKKFMNDIYLDHSAMMNDKQIKFTNSTLVDFDFTFDENKLKEVFTNLIQNSVDFVPNNGKITIDAKKSDDGIVFSVSDNGIGISKEHQNHLFKKFYQVDTSLTREHDGLGLGLSISRSIVEKLGGKIWISSGDESSGISVNFSIPKDVS